MEEDSFDARSLTGRDRNWKLPSNIIRLSMQSWPCHSMRTTRGTGRTWQPIHCASSSVPGTSLERRINQCIEGLVLRDRPQPKVHRQVREECFDFGRRHNRRVVLPMQRSNRL